MNTLGDYSRKNLEGVHPHLLAVICAAMISSPIDFTVTEGVRTTKRQRELWELGRSTKGIVVTYKDGINQKSNHQVKADGYGHAVDIYAYIAGKIDLTGNHMEEIAKHIKKVSEALGYPISWGGDWKTFKDRPHFELD